MNEAVEEFSVIQRLIGIIGLPCKTFGFFKEKIDWIFPLLKHPLIWQKGAPLW